LVSLKYYISGQEEYMGLGMENGILTTGTKM
jgi:hypothetical protein